MARWEPGAAEQTARRAMTDMGPPGASQMVKDLAEGFSNQARLSNRIWIALMLLAIVFALPGSSTRDGLPFGLGAVDPGLIDPITLFISSLLTVAFCQSRRKQ